MKDHGLVYHSTLGLRVIEKKKKKKKKKLEPLSSELGACKTVKDILKGFKDFRMKAKAKIWP